MARILVIEDEAPLREEVSEWLIFEGHEVIQAGDGRLGIERALAEHPDLIISDIAMPEMDGHRVLLELRTHAETALTPFIFLTARAERKDLRYGMEIGADDYITKPFTREELLASVEMRLQKLGAIAAANENDLNNLRKTIIYFLPHELRTPLVAIVGYGEMLATEEFSFKPEDIWPMGKAIVKSGRRLQRLIENYLLYAQIEVLIATGGQREDNVVLEHPHLVIRDSARKSAQDADRLADLFPELAPGMIQIPLKDLQKILQELVDNAFKFSKPGEPVQIYTQTEGNYYTITIRDQGRGMSPEQISQVGAYMQFDRYVYEQQGSGLGLIIAKRLAELHGGGLALEALSPGLAVTVYLPVATTR
jgi:two-component system, sensor histidine kinase and response regulator